MLFLSTLAFHKRDPRPLKEMAKGIPPAKWTNPPYFRIWID